MFYVCSHMSTPSLLPEHVDAMLARVAELCMAKAEDAASRMSEATDIADFERAGRTFNGLCRNLRQVFAMKQRFDRQQADLAADRRREDAAERQDAEHA